VRMCSLGKGCIRRHHALLRDYPGSLCDARVRVAHLVV